MKIVISDAKTGKTYQTELPKEKEPLLAGLTVGGAFDGGLVGASGYKLQITGGSDREGFPIRPDVKGGRRISALLSGGAGMIAKRKGEMRRKVVRGSAVTSELAQLNTKILDYGEKPLAELFPSTKKEEEGKK